MAIINTKVSHPLERITAILPDIDATFADAIPIPLLDLFDRFNRSEQAGLQLFPVLATASLTILGQTLKAAHSNPAEVIKSK